MAHDRLAAGRPDLVTVRVMDWPDGAVALDYTVNNAVGYPDMTGPQNANGPPDPVNHVLPAWGLLTRAYAAFAMVSAVRHREQTGAGGEVRIPLSDVAIGTRDHQGLAAALDAAGCVHGRYQTMLEAAHDPRLVGENPMFAPSSDNPSGETYPAAGAFATIPRLERGAPRTAPHNGQHSE